MSKWTATFDNYGVFNFGRAAIAAHDAKAAKGLKPIEAPPMPEPDGYFDHWSSEMAQRRGEEPIRREPYWLEPSVALIAEREAAKGEAVAYISPACLDALRRGASMPVFADKAIGRDVPLYTHPATSTPKGEADDPVRVAAQALIHAITAHEFSVPLWREANDLVTALAATSKEGQR